MQDIIEKRGGATVRGEVLSWLTFVQTVANVFGPLLLGALAGASLVDGRVVFYACAACSVASAALVLAMARSLRPASADAADATDAAKHWALAPAAA